MMIERLVYTKVDPGQSPWGKTGFHTVFYPVALLDRPAVVELERRIHLPDAKGFDRKVSCFCLRAAGEEKLVLLLTRSLPDARDQYGRTGVFLCEAFFFPGALWASAARLLPLAGLVEGARFASREELLASPLVDRAKGSIAPLEVADGEVDKLARGHAPPLAAGLERDALMLVARLALHEKWPASVVVKGDPGAAGEFADRIAAWLPAACRKRAGWDPGFDGGDATRWPLGIVGYAKTRPQSGDTVAVDLAAGEMKSARELGPMLRPDHPFTRWLAHAVEREGVTRAAIEDAWALSTVLDEGAVPAPGGEHPELAAFTAANGEEVVGRFVERGGRLFGGACAKALAEGLAPERMMTLMAGGMDRGELARELERASLERALFFRLEEDAVDRGFLGAAGPLLAQVLRLWTGKKPAAKELAALGAEERLAFARYVIRVSGGEVPRWLGEHIVEDLGLLGRLLVDGECAGGAGALLASRADRDPRWDPLVETFLAGGLWSDDDCKDLLAWAKKRKPPAGAHPYVRAFLAPSLPLPPEVLGDAAARGRLCFVLAAHHGWDAGRLAQAGFSTAEVREAAERRAARGLGARFKRLLGGER